MKALLVPLAGNPNCGKSTLFNSITGAHVHVGNYPGITVDRHELLCNIHGQELRLVDLPGTYSLSAYSAEEVVARRVLVPQNQAERPDLVINVVNASALERNLYLTLQLREMGVPVIMALNMMDEAETQGRHIDVHKLASLLDLPVVPCVGRSGHGLHKLMHGAVHLVKAQQGKPREAMRISYGPDIEPVLERMERAIAEAHFLPQYLPRWVALKYLEEEELLLNEGAAFSAEAEKEAQPKGPSASPAAGSLHNFLLALRKPLADHVRQTLDSDLETLLSDYRHGYITGLLRQCMYREMVYSLRQHISEHLDDVLTHRLLGPLIMLAVLYFMYQFVLGVGAVPMGWLETGFGWLADTVNTLMPDGLLRSLLVSGIIDGVGGVLGFVPLIFLLFMVLAFLEDSGYMARIAHMLDRVFRTFGLHGCSVMPFIISGGIPGGCAVPGIMATRTLRSPLERLATMLTAPFLSCGAKLPVFLLLVSVFFPESQQGLVLFLLTLTGWAVALLVALLLRKTFLSGPSTPFVLELPPYRLPTWRGMFIHAWERTAQYMKKAGTVILAISILLWAAMTFPGLPAAELEAFAMERARVEASLPTNPGSPTMDEIDALEAQAALRHSLAGRVGTALEPASELAGFDWRVNIALLAGVAAKEVVVSTLGTAYSLGDVDPEDAGLSLGQRLHAEPNWNVYNAVALLLFVMLYAPCFVTLVMIRRESGSWKWPLFSLFFNTILAYSVAVAVYQFGKILG